MDRAGAASASVRLPRPEVVYECIINVVFTEERERRGDVTNHSPSSFFLGGGEGKGGGGRFKRGWL